MSTKDTSGVKSPATTGSTEPDERDVRAVTEYLTVLDDLPAVADADGLYVVVSESGESYTVDARTDACQCPYKKYRGIRCKHARRVAYATGREPIPAGIDAEEIDDDLGRHVGGEVRRAATDGGTAADGAEVLSTPSDGPTWEGPFTEYGRYGEPTGARYVRCRGCGVEVLEGSQEHASHRDGCSHAEGGEL